MIDYQAALDIATRCDNRNDLLPSPTDHIPTDDEAIETLNARLRTCGFNWLTGIAAIEAIKEHRNEAHP